jgi:hypothetical protein
MKLQEMKYSFFADTPARVVSVSVSVSVSFRFPFGFVP